MVHPFSLSRFKELLCIGNRTRLTNDGNLHLAWISHLILDFVAISSLSLILSSSVILSAPTITRSSRPA